LRILGDQPSTNSSLTEANSTNKAGNQNPRPLKKYKRANKKQMCVLFFHGWLLTWQSPFCILICNCTQLLSVCTVVSNQNLKREEQSCSHSRWRH
jgi:hypothetical protein